jgi:dipeptidase E
MKLFLSSLAISDKQLPEFTKLVGKPAAEIKITLIENAADPHPENKWVLENRNKFLAHGFKIDLLDLKKYQANNKGLFERLENSDVIRLGGGNTYFLRFILRQTKADKMIKQLVNDGKVFGGDSAGAIMAGPTIEYFQDSDFPKTIPTKDLDGLKLIDTVVIPHWGSEKYDKASKTVEQKLKKAGYKTVKITDEQVFVLDDDKQLIIS